MNNEDAQEYAREKLREFIYNARIDNAVNAGLDWLNNNGDRIDDGENVFYTLNSIKSALEITAMQAAKIPE